MREVQAASMTRLERERRLARARVVKSDAELIAEAVQQGRVRKIARGVSGLPMPWVPHPSKPGHDLTGRVFGRWTVVEQAPRDETGHQRWRVRCCCGVTAVIQVRRLRQGRSLGCGNPQCRSEPIEAVSGGIAEPSATV